MARVRVGARVCAGEAVSAGSFVAGVSVALLAAAGAVAVAAQAPPLERVGSIPGSADVLAAAGDLLVAGSGTGVRIVDVSRPESASVAGRHEFDQPVLDLAVGRDDERVVYVANSHGGLRRLDLSEPAAPVVSGTVATRGQAVGVAASDGHVYVGDNSLGFDIVLAAGDLRRAGEYLGDGFPRDIAAAGALVFVADQPAGLIVVDVSDPAAPTVTGGLSLGREPITGVVVPDARSWDSAPPSVVAVASGAGGLQVVDVSDPRAPTVATPIAPAGRFAGAAMWGERLFVAGDGALRVFDLADPGQPALIAESELGGGVGAVAADEELVFAATPGEILIFRHP